MIFSRAAGSSVRPSKKKPDSGQNSASVEILSCEIATASSSPERPVKVSRRLVSSSTGSSRR